MSVGRGWLGFSIVLLVVNGGAAWLLSLLTKDPLVARAVWTSAAAAAGVQLIGFGCAKLMMGRDMGLFAAWGAAMGIRFLSLVVYALLVFKVLGLVPAPALVSFAGLLLLTSIVEPLFLNA
ncbi:hypothetical protein LBMAG44_17400 [Gemmatimonadota bacterium]|nr:hypothetical protein LBMAG44_17400 [Gemmatimonadota bacterium]